MAEAWVTVTSAEVFEPGDLLHPAAEITRKGGGTYRVRSFISDEEQVAGDYEEAVQMATKMAGGAHVAAE